MDLVVDANVLFAALLGRDKSMELFFEDRIRLFAPSYLLYEFEKNKEELAKSCNISLEEFTELFTSLKSRINIYPLRTISLEVKSKAVQLAPHKKDVPYFALAVHIGAAIWSKEKAFRKQRRVKVYSTTELVDMFLIK